MAAGCSDRDGVEAYLEDAWPAYLELYVHPSGYVLDPRRDDGRVTSEGQGYALLRSVWERDPAAFERISGWTQDHLQRPDGLHAWLWSPEEEGRVVDPNSATDGDLEIAWAYLLAAQVFQDAELSARGETILRAVRRASALPVQGGWFPAAGDWAVAERIANLSYFLPYAHPWFAMADPEGDWDRVTEVGYDLIRRFRAEPGRRLPPAFFRLEPSGSTAPLATDSELETDFSFDAIRLFWRVEADCRITGRRPACSDPVGVAEALEVLVGDDGIVSRYAPDGTPLTDAQSPTFYAALLAPARRYAPNVARDLLAPRLAPGALAALLEARDRYYDHNWVWFGIALDRGLIEARTPSPPTR